MPRVNIERISTNMASVSTQRSRSKISLTPEGWIFVAILVFVTVGAILRNVNLLVIMSGMMFAPLLLSWRIGSHLMRHTNACRLVQNRIHVGQIVNFQWMIHNQSRLPLWNFLVRDQMTCLASPWSDDAAALKKKTFSRTQVAFHHVAMGDVEYVSYQCLFTDRGMYEVGPAVVSSRFPFGLIRAWRRYKNSEQFYVAPRIGILKADWDRQIVSQAVGAESLLRRRGADQEEFYALREWRSGDSRRQIHWRTTAKADQLMVKQYDQKTNRDIAIVLDLFSRNDMGPLVEQQQEADCESALSFVATLLIELGNDSQGKIGIAIAGQQTQVHVDHVGADFLSGMMRELSVARSAKNPEVISSILEIHQGMSVGTPVLVVSSRPYSEDWLESQMGSERWRKMEKDLRWIAVGSPEFQSVFHSDNQEQQAVAEFLQKELRDASW